MEGRSRKPMTSGVGLTALHLNPALREHWLFSRFKELQDCQTCDNSTEYIGDIEVVTKLLPKYRQCGKTGFEPNFTSKGNIAKKYGRGK